MVFNHKLSTTFEAPKQTVEKETQYLIQKSACISNDCHIIALARASGARLLCSDDVKLGEDFKNKKWIDKPRGKIYKNATHNKLLKKRCNKFCFFSGKADRFKFSDFNYRWRVATARSLLNQLYKKYFKEGFVMSYTWDDFHREYTDKFIESLPPET